MKIPYQLIAAVDTYTRHTQMLAAIKRGFPRLKSVPIDDTQAHTMYVACYGPSLQDTWKELEGKHPLISMSGATRFLADRGIVPDYHCDMDPRSHKQKFIDPPVPGVHYLMASVCHPGTWDILKDQQVTLWHAVSCHSCTEQFVSIHDPGELVVSPGSTIGLGALHLGGILGYRHFEIYGMDGSFKEGARHAGEHFGKKQKDYITWDANRVTYRTSRIMANGVAETINQVTHSPMFCVFHGEGLTQALIRKAKLPNACCADEVEKAEKVRRMTARVIVLDDRAAQEVKKLSGAFEAILSYPPPEWVTGLATLSTLAETRRGLAKFNTGTVNVDAMLFLRALVEVTKPAVVAEVGTFIGSSTLAMQAGLRTWGGHLYTCDNKNDCLPPDDGRTTYPYATSTQMFEDLLAKQVKVDLFFFDGRIQPHDLPLILKLSTPKTVYAFDDYRGKDKGVTNVEMLQPILPFHVLTKPIWKDTVTIALLEPKA